LKKIEFQAVGRIQRTEGQKGELKVRLYPGVNLGTVRSVQVGRKGEVKEFAVESFRPGRNGRILKIQGIDSQVQAEALAGQELVVSPDSLRPPEEGSYYPGQLIGCRVLTRDGADLGEVKAVVPVGESGLLVAGHGEEEVFIPLAREICYEIDPAGGRIRIDPPEGLLDLNEI
jgi:16S rRNA processing protein RimM